MHLLLVIDSAHVRLILKETSASVNDLKLYVTVGVDTTCYNGKGYYQALIAAAAAASDSVI